MERDGNTRKGEIKRLIQISIKKKHGDYLDGRFVNNMKRMPLLKGSQRRHLESSEPAPEAPGSTHKTLFAIHLNLRSSKLALQQLSVPVHLPGVLLWVDGHSSDPQLGAGSEHTDGDLTWKQTHI